MEKRVGNRESGEGCGLGGTMRAMNRNRGFGIGRLANDVSSHDLTKTPQQANKRGADIRQV